MIKRLLFHNFRLVHRAGKWVRGRFSPAGLLLLGVAVASGLFGVDTRQSLAFQVFALTASVLLVAVAAGLVFNGKFRVQRRLPQFATAGLPLHYEVVVENLGKANQRELLVLDELESPFPKFEEFRSASDPDDRRRNWFDRRIGYPRLMGMLRRRRGGWIDHATVEEVAAADRAEVPVRLQPLRRGYIHFSRLRLARTDPLGLFRAVRVFPEKDALLVLPRMYKVSPLRLRSRRRYQQGGLQLASLVGDSQEFKSLRDYKPGDPLRSIHWRSYAKVGEPVVKEFQDEFFARQGLVLDTFLDARPPSVFEEAVSVAASFARFEPSEDSILDLMFVGTEAYRFSAGRGLGGVENMLEILACVEPCRDQPFSVLSNLLTRYHSGTSGLICVFLDWDEGRRDLVSRLTAAGTSIVVFVLSDNPADVEADAGPLGGDPRRLRVLDTRRVQEQLDDFFDGPVIT